MWTINSEYRVERDPYNWILVRTIPGGEPITRGKYKGQISKPKEERKYYGTIRSLCCAVINAGLDADGTYNDVLRYLDATEEDLKRFIEQWGKDNVLHGKEKE